MQDELDICLRDAHQRALRFDEITASLKQMQFEKEISEQNILKYKAALAGASLELYKSEPKTASIFNSIRGTADKRLEMERNNTIAARLRLSRAEKELRELDQIIEDLKAESQRFAGSGEEYEGLYEQKKQNLIAEGGTGAQLVIDLSGGINIAKARLKEIKEAYKACETAISYLSSSKKKLEQAKTWGTIDMMGGKFVASAIKHSHIKSAMSDAGIANAIIRDMNSTAACADIEPETDIKSTGRGRISDIFMDNIVTDTFVQSRIENSLGNVDTVKIKLQSRLCKLTVVQHQVEKDLNDMQAKLDSIILARTQSAG